MIRNLEAKDNYFLLRILRNEYRFCINKIIKTDYYTNFFLCSGVGSKHACSINFFLFLAIKLYPISLVNFGKIFRIVAKL